MWNIELVDRPMYLLVQAWKTKATTVGYYCGQHQQQKVKEGEDESKSTVVNTNSSEEMERWDRMVIIMVLVR